MIDYYQVLGLTPAASAEDIKKAYRDLALNFHPDKNPTDQNAHTHFQLISEAYTILSNPKTRSEFDQERESAKAAEQVATAVESLPQAKKKKKSTPAKRKSISLPTWFGFSNRGQRRQPTRRQHRSKARRRQQSWWNLSSPPRPVELPPEPTEGEDLHREIEITIQDIAKGIRKTVPIEYEDVCHHCVGSGSQHRAEPRRCNRCDGLGTVQNLQGDYEVKEPCPSCLGKGMLIDHLCRQCFGKGAIEQKRQIAINIQPGVQDSTILKIANHGKSGLHGGENGDLYLTIRQAVDERFSRQGDDLTCEIDLDFIDAVLGAKVKIDTLDDTLDLMVPPGVQPGQILPVPRHGLPKSNGEVGRGDLFVKVRVLLPDEVTHRQRKLLVQFYDSPNMPIKTE